jgi:enoyl-CoA hydratase/carnithine racemase
VTTDCDPVPAVPYRIHRDGPVLVLTFDDPATRNALAPDIYDAFAGALLEADEGVRAVVLTGAGGTFCSGGNVRRLEAARAGSIPEQRARIERLHGLVRAIQDARAPVIAAVEGWASGAGFSLALACDLLVAADDARFSMAYVRVGLSPDGGATAFLAAALPPQAAAEILLTGDPVPAPRLHALGVANRLAAPGRAFPEALALAHRLAVGPPLAMGRAKALLAAARGGASLAEQLDREADAFAEQLFTDEAGEGLAAFRERRTPRF